MLEKHKHKHRAHNFDGIVDDRGQKIPWYFTALFYGLVGWGVLFMGYYLFSGWSSHAEFEARMAAHDQARQVAAASAPAPAAAAPAAGAASGDALAKGKELYAKRCAMCHGKDGHGGVGPNLTKPDYHYGRDLAAVVESITAGRPAGMPAFGNELAAAEIQAVAQFVLTLP